MAVTDPTRDAVAWNVEGVRQLVESGFNKLPRGTENGVEGPIGPEQDLFELDIPDAELLRIADERIALYRPYEGKIRKLQDMLAAYYSGRQNAGSAYDTQDGPIVGNLIWEAVETYLPAALAKNPDPIVWGENNALANKLAEDVKTMLSYHAEILDVRGHLKILARRWLFDLLGVIKYGWNENIDDITFSVRDVKNFYFYPNGYVDVYGNFKGWLGERIMIPAEEACKRFPDHKEAIYLSVKGAMASEIQYTEWWDDDRYFITYDKIVLDKGKNYFFNYGKNAKNHFAVPLKPFTFLSVFTIQNQPHDITGPIEQNIPQQNRYTRRLKQIDANAQNTNNGLAISAENYTQQTAKQAARARQMGQPILVPPGRPVQEAVVSLPATPVSPSLFEAANQDALNLRSIFGTQGITSQPANEDTTARGMILNKQYDSSRIGGGIGEALARVSDSAFNWFYQMYHVFYDTPHEAKIMGVNKAVEYSVLSSDSFTSKLVISVAPDSMKPRDDITLMNQALQLWQEGALDPKSLFKFLNFPDPDSTSEMATLWKLSPQMYMQLNYPQLMQQLQQMQASAQAPQAPSAPQAAPGAPPAPVEQPTPTTTTAEAPPSAVLQNVPLPK